MEIAKVDLRGVVSGGAGWEAARAAVTASMVAHGCVIVVAPDALGADLRRAVFSRALPELFALPVEVKHRMVLSKKGHFRGHIGEIDGMNWESFAIWDPTDAASLQGFAETLWPEGNPEFCETIVPFAKNMLELEEMVETMVLEGLGVRGELEHRRPHSDLLSHSFRLSHYAVSPDTENSISMGAHCDHIMLNVIVQHEVEGLEVHAGDDGRWVAVPPEPGTFTFVAGDQFRVVTNGRVPACLHRVRTPSNRERISVQFGCRQKDGVMVRAHKDLVDAEHPLVFNPLRPLRHEELSNPRIHSRPSVEWTIPEPWHDRILSYDRQLKSSPLCPCQSRYLSSSYPSRR